MNRGSLVIVVLVLACGCSRAMPAAFWPTYRPNLIDQKFSDQGPWGGVRWILWSSSNPGTFRASDVMEFAKSKGWSCRSPVPYSADQLRLWQFNRQAVFPLHFSAADRRPDNAAVLTFPRHITADSVVCECKTGWMRVEPGTDTASDAFGYIQIEQSGRRMAVYHLWGEI